MWCTNIYKASQRKLGTSLHCPNPTVMTNPLFFNMHSWRHPGRAKMLCMLSKMIHKYTTCMCDNNDNKNMVLFQTFLIQNKLLKLNLNFLITRNITKMYQKNKKKRILFWNLYDFLYKSKVQEHRMNSIRKNWELVVTSTQ